MSTTESKLPTLDANEVIQVLEQREPAEDDAVTKKQGTGGKGEKGKQERKPFLQCDLCGAVLVDDHGAHAATEHADVDLIDQLSSARQRQSGGEDVEAAAVNYKVGRAAYRAVSHADRGEEMFNVILRATKQMSGLLSMLDEKPSLYLFGSCVTMGLWDGIGDADYTLHFAQLDDPATGEPPHTFQSDEVLVLARRLRQGGFAFDELEVVPRARVPVVRRKRDTKRPYEPRSLQEPYSIEYSFANEHLKNEFIHASTKSLSANYGAKLEKESKASLTYTFADGTMALLLFARRERWNGANKAWKLHCRLPEVFSVDFDLSCRTFGVRNSWFLRRYLEQHFLFRVGSLFIKEWSKQCGVNNSRNGYLTSYAMNNLWVYYLLRKGMVRFVDPDSLPRTPSAQAYGEVAYMPLWDAHEEQSERDSFNVLGAIIRDFFHFYAEEFDWATEVVSLRHDCGSDAQGNSGKLVTKAELGWTPENEMDSLILRDRTFYRVCIEDVYETNFNLGRHLSPHKAQWFLAQFRYAWAWYTRHGSSGGEGEEQEQGLGLGAAADTGAWTSLLDDGYGKRGEEVLRVAVHVHLVQHGGRTSVSDLQAMLRQRYPGLLASFETTHRLSDLWYDYDVLKEVRENSKLKGRREEVPPAPELREDEPEAWAAVCSTALLPAASPASGAPGERIVFLANSEILPKGEETPASVVAAQLELKAAMFQRAAEEIVAAKARTTHAAAGTGMREPVDLRRGSALVQNAFYLVDGLAFATYREREIFGKHLGAMAEVLSQPAATAELVAALKGKRRSESGQAAFPVVEKLYNKTHGDGLSASVVAFLFDCIQYIRMDQAGNPAATDLLLLHRAKDSIEEDKRRARAAPSRQNERKEAKSRQQVPIRRNLESGVTGTCTYCSTKHVTVYATTYPKVDCGVYCMKCWDAY